MSTVSEVAVNVPASSANLGPGYDCLGLALELRNRVVVRPADAFGVEVEGEGGSEAEQPRGQENILVRAYLAAWSRARGDEPPPSVSFAVKATIPLARGLGSSAAAAVAGALAALAHAGRPDDRDLALAVAAEIEGHPDNAAASLVGGLVICAAGVPGADGPHGEAITVRRVEPSPLLGLTLVIPELTLRTEDARAAVPRTVPAALAARNAGRVALLVTELAAAEPDPDRVAAALADELHEPAREPLVPCLRETRERARELGAWGAVLSGAGPSVLLVHQRDLTLDAAALLAPWRKQGIAARVVPLEPAREGAKLLDG